MWSAFDHLAGRLRLPISAAITEAAREWVTNHENDPAPETVFKPRRGDLPPGTPDPFPPVV